MRSNENLINNFQHKNEQLIQIICNTKVNTSYCYEPIKLLDEKTDFLQQNCSNIIDFGKSSRHNFDKFDAGQIITADINEYDGYPDIICDIYDAESLPLKKFDGIICNSVIEHVYDPFAATKNMYELLEDGGYCMCFAPFNFRYHAPKDLSFQDYFRFSRDGMALLFKDFSEVELYSVRGKYSAGLTFSVSNWKKIERKFSFINKLIDKIGRGYADPLQNTGYLVWAKK